MSTSSTKADQNHSGKTYRNTFACVSFVLRFACAVLILRSTQPAVLMLESMSFFSLGRCKTPGEQYTNKTLHSRCQTAMPIWCYPEGNLFIRSRCRCSIHNRMDGGDRRDRTDDLKLAKLPLSQLSYVPSYYIHRNGGPGRT